MQLRARVGYYAFCDASALSRVGAIPALLPRVAQNDSLARRQFRRNLGRARLSARKNTARSGAWHKFNNCLGFSVLEGDVTQPRQVVGCFCKKGSPRTACTTLQFEFTEVAGT